MNHYKACRMAYAIIFADRRVGETDEQAAERASKAMEVPSEKALHYAHIEKQRRNDETKLPPLRQPDNSRSAGGNK